ncbi:MAG: response regulator [Thermodesulfobacteriota bacterium]
MPSPSPSAKVNRLLLVDDEPIILELLQRQLNQRGYSVETADSGQRAMEVLAASRPFDILVTDIRMPGMDGMTLLKTARKSYPEMEAIMVTGHGDMDTALEAMRLGAYNFLTKPVGISELSAVLGNCQEKIHLQQEVAQKQAALQEAHDQLEIRVNRRTAELTRANALLADEIELSGQVIQEIREKDARLRRAQKMEALGSLAGGIAHDFNNLLMGIQGHVSLLLGKSDNQPPVLSHLLNIEQLVESGGRLTKQLLGYARKGQYDVRVHNLCDIITNICETFGRTHKNIDIANHFPVPCLAVKADQGQLEQILFNLLINASDAMPQGGSINIDTEIVPFAAIASKMHKGIQGDYIHLSFSDNGEGIPEEIQDHIFEPFFTTKPQSRGTGLGLASTYGIVAGYGGLIEIKSRLGRGTTFHVYLPASSEKPASQGRFSDLASRPPGGRVLLVDDEYSIREICKELLTERGFTVTTAANGVEAISHYQEDEFDIVVLDMVMPEKGGSETFDELQRLDPEIKVILSSGYSLEGEAADIVKRGCSAFIQKPFNMADLTNKIMEII